MAVLSWLGDLESNIMASRCGILFVLLFSLVCFCNSVPVRSSKPKPTTGEEVLVPAYSETEEPSSEDPPSYKGHAYGSRYGNAPPSKEEDLPIKPQQRQLEPSEEESSIEETTSEASTVTEKYKNAPPSLSQKVGVVADKKKPLNIKSQGEEPASDEELEGEEEETEAEETEELAPLSKKHQKKTSVSHEEQESSEEGENETGDIEKPNEGEEENEETQEDETDIEKTNTSEEEPLKEHTKSTHSKSSAVKTKPQTEDTYEKEEEDESVSQKGPSQLKSHSSLETTTSSESELSEETTVQDKFHKLQTKVPITGPIDKQKAKKTANKTPSKLSAPGAEKESTILELTTASLESTTLLPGTTEAEGEQEELEVTTVNSLTAQKQPLKYGKEEASKLNQKPLNAETEVTEQVREIAHERHQYRLPAYHN